MKRIQVVSKIVVIIAITMLSLMGCGRQSKVIVAKVDDEQITKSRYNAYLWSAQEYFESLSGDIIWDMEIEGRSTEEIAKERALESIISSVVAEKEAERMGIDLDETQKEEIRKEAEQFVELNKAVVDAYGFGVEDIEYLLQTASLRLLVEKKIGESYMPSEQEITLYIEQVKGGYETVTAKHIFLSKVDESGNLLPENIREERLTLANTLRERVEAGEDISELALEYSEDEESKASGGQYTFPRGVMVVEFEEMAFSLAENEVAPHVVETPYGYHVIQTISHNQAEEDQIRADYIERAQIEFSYTELAELRNNVVVEKYPEYDEIELIRNIE